MSDRKEPTPPPTGTEKPPPPPAPPAKNGPTAPDRMSHDLWKDLSDALAARILGIEAADMMQAPGPVEAAALEMFRRMRTAKRGVHSGRAIAAQRAAGNVLIALEELGLVITRDMVPKLIINRAGGEKES